MVAKSKVSVVVPLLALAGQQSGRCGSHMTATRRARSAVVAHRGEFRPHVRGRREEGCACRGQAGFGQQAGSEAAARWRPCPLFLFLNFFPQLFSNQILTNLKAFSEFTPRIKVVRNKFLYNFALRYNFKF